MNASKEQYLGCILGLATGDALGAPHEGGILERGLWRLLGQVRSGVIRWTDDTQMAIDLAESILANDGLSQDALALQFARSYKWHRGYGPGTVRILRRIQRGHHWSQANLSVYPDGSFGNGAAMRSPVLALAFPKDTDQLRISARDSAAITHSHPDGVEGAVVIAVATQAILRRMSPTEVMSLVKENSRSSEIADRLAVAATWLQEESTPSPGDVARSLGHGMTAPTSCATALYIALRHLSQRFEAMMKFIISCGGDVDTIGAMAGALWGSSNGASTLPSISLEAKEYLEDTALRLYGFALQHQSAGVQD